MRKKMLHQLSMSVVQFENVSCLLFENFGATKLTYFEEKWLKYFLKVSVLLPRKINKAENQFSPRPRVEHFFSPNLLKTFQNLSKRFQDFLHFKDFGDFQDFQYTVEPRNSELQFSGNPAIADNFGMTNFLLSKILQNSGNFEIFPTPL